MSTTKATLLGSRVHSARSQFFSAQKHHHSSSCYCQSNRIEAANIDSLTRCPNRFAAKLDFLSDCHSLHFFSSFTLTCWRLKMKLRAWPNALPLLDCSWQGWHWMNAQPKPVLPAPTVLLTRRCPGKLCPGSISFAVANVEYCFPRRKCHFVYISECSVCVCPGGSVNLVSGQMAN